MRYRTLGRTNARVSVLCLGTMTFGWTTDEPASFEVMSEALDRGINFFDTADIYSRWSPRSHAGKTEEIMGRWFAQDRSRRGKVVLATKVRGQMSDAPGDEGLSRAHITRSIENSLRRLQTDYVDLYQSHWWDEAVTQEETLRAYEDLVKSGKVRAIGCSNYTAPQLRDALDFSEREGIPRYESLQPHYNLVHRAEFERELQALCVARGVGVIPYSPLAGGFLTGKYKRGEGVPAGSRGEESKRVQAYTSDPRNYDLLDELARVAAAHGSTVASVALAWVVGAPAITSAIIGANTVAQLRGSLEGADLELSPDERARIDALSAPQ